MLRTIFRGADTEIHVPALCDIEYISTIRRRVIRRLLSTEQAEQAILDYVSMPLTRHHHLRILGRILELRDAFTAYDAAYVALAESLHATLVTSDRSLARGVRGRSRIEVLTP